MCAQQQAQIRVRYHLFFLCLQRFDPMVLHKARRRRPELHPKRGRAQSLKINKYEKKDRRLQRQKLRRMQKSSTTMRRQKTIFKKKAVGQTHTTFNHGHGSSHLSNDALPPFCCGLSKATCPSRAALTCFTLALGLISRFLVGVELPLP